MWKIHLSLRNNAQGSRTALGDVEVIDVFFNEVTEVI